MALIDLDALAFNYHSAAHFLGSETIIMGVIKANAYGHGAVPVARRLAAEGIAWFGVALPEEGVALRKAGILTPILCMGSVWPGQEELIAEYGLIPAIFDKRAAIDLNTHARARGVLQNIHVKIDTGMGRIGLRFDECPEYATFLRTLDSLQVTGLMTHFASAENAMENEFTNVQIDRFDAACAAFRDAGHDPELIDLANSPAAIGHPRSRKSLVRLGGALYGLLDDILSRDAERPEFKPVLSLRSQIASLKTLRTGESAGYGRTFFALRDSLIAAVPIGYADGYPRRLSNNVNVIIGNETAPVVGRISMDWTLVDVTNLVNVKVGDDVTLIGTTGTASVTAGDLAAKLGTIGYEITCGISSRVPRVYIGERPA